MPGKRRLESEFWSPKEAAMYLGVCPNVIYQWINPASRNNPKSSGLRVPPPPFHRFTRNTIRIPIAEFKEWVKLTSAVTICS